MAEIAESPDLEFGSNYTLSGLDDIDWEELERSVMPSTYVVSIHTQAVEEARGLTQS